MATKRIAKKIRDRVHRLWRERPDLSFVQAAALLGCSDVAQKTRLIVRYWKRAARHG